MNVTTSEVDLSIVTNPNLSIDAIKPAPAPRAAPPLTGFLSRLHILEATEACFAQFGYDGTTIRAIAKHLGCAVGSIYRYFTDKETLLLACASRVIDPVLRQFEQPGVTVEASIITYVGQARVNSEMYHLLTWLGTRRGGTADVIRQVIDAWGRQLGDNSAARQCWATVHGMLLLGATEQQIIGAALDSPTADIAPRFMAAPALIEPQVIVPTQAPAAEPEDVTLL